MSARNLFAAVGVVVLAAALVGAGVAVADIGADRAAASNAPGGTDRTINVAATGEVQTNPDKSVIRLAVESTHPNASVARDRVAENVSQMKAALADLGIEESQIRTVDFNLYKDEPHGPEREERGTVYRVSHEFVVEVDDIDQVGSVIDALVNTGATNIYDIKFTLSESTRKELRKQALDAAMAEARTEANVIADSADLTITGVHTVTTSNVDFPRRRVEFALAADGAGTDISSGPVTVSATVQVTYNATG